MRKFAVLLTLLAMLMTFSAVTAQDEVVIDFYYPLAVDGPLTAVIQEYADAFMEQNPNIRVNPVYTGSYTQTRETILTEGADPIVDVAVMLGTDLYSFVEEGTVIALNDYLSQEQIDDTFESLWLNSLDSEGTYWSIPFQRSTPVLYYNVEMLAEAGFDAPPANNEEMLAMAQALTTDEGAGLLIPVAGNFPIWMVESFVNAYGEPFSTFEDPATVAFNTPATLAAVTYLHELGAVYGIGPVGGSAWGDTPTAFNAGQAAMVYHTTGSLTSILNNAPFEVGVAFTPSGPAGEDGTGYGTPTGGGNLYIFDNGTKTQAELDAAWLWVEYLASPEIQSDWGVASGYIAARISAWEMEPLASHTETYPQYLAARDQLSIADKEFSSYRAIDVQNIINSTLSRVLSGEVALADAPALLEQAQAQIDGLLAEYK